MAERVYTDGEISLNGVKYPVKGPVTSFLASVYPEKQVFGNITEDSNPDVSVISWTDFTGGTGLYRMRTPADNRRYYVSSCFTSRQGQVTISAGSRAVGTGYSTLIGANPLLGELPSGASSAGEIYAMGANKVIFKYDNGGAIGTRWAAVGLSLAIHSCDAAWDESVDADVTVSLDTSTHKEGTGANQFVVAAGASAGDILATDDFAAKDLSSYTQVDFWIRSSVTTTSGQLQLLLDDTALCASPLETLDVPALSANTWTRARVTLANPGSDTAIISVGLKYTADIGACTIKIDDIRATKAATTAPTDVCNALVNGAYYLVYACNSANTVWSSNGTTWTDSAQDSLYVCAWNEQLWGITSAGQLWYTSDMSTFTNDAVLPSGAGTIKGLVVGRDAAGEPIIYALTTKGLYAHDFANTKFWQTEFPDTAGTYYGRPREWSGMVCMPIDDVVWMYRASTGQVIATSPALPDGFAAADSDLVMGGAARVFGPYIIALAPMGGRLYALAGHSDGATSFVEAVYYFDGAAWHGIWEYSAAVTGTGKAQLLASTAYNTQRLYMSDVLGGSGIIYAVMPSFTGDLDYWASTSRLTTPWFDGFDAMAVKTALRVHVNVRGTSANETVQVYYALNYGKSSATSLGTITNSDGVTTYEFPDSTTPTGTDFRAIRFTVKLTSTNSTPILVSISLEYRKKPAVRMGFEMDLDLTSDYDAKTPQGLRSALQTAIASTTKVEFTFRDDTGTGNPRNYYVDIKSPRSLEKTGRQEEGLTHLVLIET